MSWSGSSTTSELPFISAAFSGNDVLEIGVVTMNSDSTFMHGSAMCSSAMGAYVGIERLQAELFWAQVAWRGQDCVT
jgi:hypothetical protein